MGCCREKFTILLLPVVFNILPFSISSQLLPASLFADQAILSQLYSMLGFQNLSFTSAMARDPSPPCLPDLVIKVNYDLIEGKSVSLGLYTSSLESHGFKAENLHRKIESTKVPLG